MNQSLCSTACELKRSAQFEDDAFARTSVMTRVRGRHYLNGEVYDFHLEDGLIRAIGNPAGDGDVLGGEDCWVVPGLIDIQVNGFNGHDFCSGEVTVDDVVGVAEEIVTAGVTAFCPTVATNSSAAVESSVRAIALACEKNRLARERILGIHLEGPYISPTDGPRGVHPLEHVRDPDWEEFTRFQDAAGGRIRLVTLAPELPNALEFISRARKAGIVVGIGHHTATREQINAAVSAGAVLATHLGNGAHDQLPRHHNYIWEQLANDALMASIIVDGHHLPPAVVKSFYRVKGPHRLILISDAISAAGLPPGNYRLMGSDISVVENGLVRLSGTPYQAGSTLKLCDAIHNVMHFAGAAFSDAVRMATENPARLLGVDRDCGCLRVGARADITLLRFSLTMCKLALTVAGGQVCYQA
jgi:N-acetylglucosamine-6-phosphate deacetylase